MGTVDNVNPKILKECREQMAYKLEGACDKSGIKTIEKMEAGEEKPTFKQLKKLSELYCVPDWVFISKEIPEEYKFSSSPSFRRIWRGRDADSPPISPEICRLIFKVDEYRRMILEYRKDMGNPMPKYENISYNNDYKAMATAVRQWLGITKPLPFKEIRKCVEQKNIFVFTTSNYSHWSKFDINEFRGFAIYKDVLPMIVINGSDAQNAQSFTLYYELGHIIRKKSKIDGSSPSNKEGWWCNCFAGNALIPKDEFCSKINGVDLHDLRQIEELAKEFLVSADACVIRLMQLHKIDSTTCESHMDLLRKKREINKDESVLISNSMDIESLHRFGEIYAKTVCQAHRKGEITLDKLYKLLEIEQANVALKELEIL